MVPQRWRSCLTLFIVILLVEAVYLRPEFLKGAMALGAMDYYELHVKRISFAREALFGPSHMLPAWYPRELLGAPFRANLQSFPWIPTRLLLLLIDPAIAYAAGIAMAAALAAVFTYLYCRRLGLSRIAAGAAGWTFACAGFFASRMMAGHLPLLEVYPALPLLLWLADRALDPDRTGRLWLDLGWLGVATTCVVLAGHPQIPAYAVASALLYTVWRGRGWCRAEVVGSILAGAGIALAAWWPMLLLIQKSTRVLRLETAENDIALPYRRILALIDPGIDGWPAGLKLAAVHKLSGYPTTAFFWDTVGYVGLLPLIAALGFLITACIRRRLPTGRWMFLTCLGLGAFLCSLPVLQPVYHLLPGTFFRSPARLLYLTTFCLAATLGAGVDSLLKVMTRRALAYAALIMYLGFHALDLGRFANMFVIPVPLRLESPVFRPIRTEFEKILAREIHSNRIAIDSRLRAYFTDDCDDVGIFDSLLMAKPYLAVLALTGARSDANWQTVNGALMTPAALRAVGVAFVVTQKTRPDLTLVRSAGGFYLYRVEGTAPRARFYRAQSTVFLPSEQIQAALKDDPASLEGRLLLPAKDRDLLLNIAVPPPEKPEGEMSVSYRRPSSDEIVLEVSTDSAGYIDVLEAYDPGWSAWVDSARAHVMPANGFSLAIPIARGKHSVLFRYETPGRRAGFVLSGLAAALLVLLMRLSHRRTIAAEPFADSSVGGTK